MNTQKNSTNFGADVLKIASLAGEYDQGPIFLAHTHAKELKDLLAKVNAVKANGDDSMRETMLEYWNASPEGSDFQRKHAALKAIKQRTPTQEAAFSTSTKVLNSVNTMMVRTVHTFEGIDRLQRTGRKVTIARVAGSKQFACYVVNDKLGEFEQVRFTAAQLQACGGATFTEKTSTPDVRQACVTKKQGAANKDKGANGDAIPAVKIAEAVNAIDTSLAGLTAADGHSFALGKDAKLSVMLMWARLDATLTDADKVAARKAFAELGVKEEPKPAKQATQIVKSA